MEHDLKLHDVDYTDDIAPLTSSRKQMQVKVARLVKHSKSTGLKINASKTKVMIINASNTYAITAAGEEIEDVNSFIYLGGTVNNEGGTTENLRKRFCNARSAYNKLTAIWNSSQIGRNVISVLLYESETWKMTKGGNHLLDTFLYKS